MPVAGCPSGSDVEIAAAAGQVVRADGLERARLVERLPGELARRAEHRRALEPERAGELELARDAFPDEPDRSADDVRRDPHDLGSRTASPSAAASASPASSSAGRARALRDGRLAAERAHDERRLAGDELGGELLARA